MKKIKLFIIFLFLLGGCFFLYQNSKKEVPVLKENEYSEISSIFISYIDYANLKNKSVTEKQEIINEMVNNVSSLGFNEILLQVRPFADAIYKSKIFKPSTTITNSEDDILDLDILDYFINKAHQKNIKIEAWINPYRVRSTNDLTSISTSSKIYELDKNDIEISDNGIYLNPASDDVLSLILSGVEELVKNYDIDGILYDDYFYPSKTIDLNNYNEYKKNNDITLEEYRINNINKLIKETYKKIKKINPKVLFGISPSGNIENNLNEEYLDIEYLLSDGKYLDYVMPQLYYGFFNQNKPFQETITTWDNLIKKNNVSLIPVLSLYKSGKKDNYAGSGSNEWIENDDIIKKQIIISRGKENYKGFAIFRYEHLFNEERQNETMQNEVVNIKKILNN